MSTATSARQGGGPLGSGSGRGAPSGPSALLIAAALLALASVLILPRVVHLGADPAPSVSADVLTDEGWWCRNARQQALTGSAVLDDFNQAIYVAPVYNALLTLAFETGGVSLGAARAVSAAAGLLALAVIGWIAFRLAGPRTALWSVAILGGSAPFLLLNRTAFVESTLILSLALVAAAVAEAVLVGTPGSARTRAAGEKAGRGFAAGATAAIGETAEGQAAAGGGVRGGQEAGGAPAAGEAEAVSEKLRREALRRGTWFFVAGLLAALAFWTKSNALYIAVLPVVIALVVHGRRREAVTRAVALVAAGFALGFFPIAVNVILPDPAAWLSMNRLIAGAYVTPGWLFIPAALLNFPRNEAWGSLAPVAALGFGLFLGCARRVALGERKGAGEGDRALDGVALLPMVAGLWFLLSVVTTMLVPYQPERRVLTLLPPLCLLVAAALSGEVRRSRAFSPGGAAPAGPPAGSNRARPPAVGGGADLSPDDRYPRSSSARVLGGSLARWSLCVLLLWAPASFVWGTAATARVLLRGEPARWALGANVGAVEGAVVALGVLLVAAFLAREGGGFESREGKARTDAPAPADGNLRKGGLGALRRWSFLSRIETLIAVNAVYPVWLAARWAVARWVEFRGGSPSLVLIADPLAVALIPAVLWVRWRRRRRWLVRLGDAPTPGVAVRFPDPCSEPRTPSWASRLSNPVLFAVLVAIANVPSLLPIAVPTFTMRDAARRIEAVVPGDAVLAGTFADTIGLETRLRTVEIRPHFGMNLDPYRRWPRAILVTAARHERQDAEHIPPWAPQDTRPLIDLPLCPNTWTGEPRFVLRLRVRGPGRRGDDRDTAP